MALPSERLRRVNLQGQANPQTARQQADKNHDSRQEQSIARLQDHPPGKTVFDHIDENRPQAESDHGHEQSLLHDEAVNLNGDVVLRLRATIFAGMRDLAPSTPAAAIAMINTNRDTFRFRISVLLLPRPN
jgi:hypothetical protein